MNITTRPSIPAVIKDRGVAAHFERSEITADSWGRDARRAEEVSIRSTVLPVAMEPYD